MKRLFFALTMMLTCSTFSLAQNPDSLLIANQKTAIDQYKAFCTSIYDSTPVTLRAVILKADSVFTMDAQLIENLRAGSLKTDSLKIQHAALTEELAKAKETTDIIEKYKWFAIGGAGLVVFLMFLFMFMYLGKSSSSKKKIRKLNRTIGETEDLKTYASELEAKNQTLKKELSANIEKLKNEFNLEKKTWQSKIDILTASVNSKDAQIRNLETTLAEKSDETGKTNELRLQLSKFENQVNLLTSERDAALQRQTGVADQYLGQLKEKDELIEKLQLEMQAVKREKNELILATHNIPAPDNSKMEDLERELKYKAEEIEKLNSKITDIEESTRLNYEKLKDDYERLLDESKTERDARIEAERKLAEKPNDIRIESSDNKDFDELRKELEEEKAVRREMEIVLEQILKNKQS